MTSYHASKVDRKTLRAYRLQRIREQLQEMDCAGVLLYDPINIRYAVDAPNMQIFSMHYRIRYAFIATQGPVILFEFEGCEHLFKHIETISEIRTASVAAYIISGDNVERVTKDWAREISDLVTQHGGGNKRLAIDIADPHYVAGIKSCGLDVCDGQKVMERARMIKCPAEVVAIDESVAACEEGMRRMYEALQPGITENALWSILHQTNIERGGEWIETRLLTSGPKTNPWFQECGDRVINAGDMVSFDTDLVGPNGYCTDISRSWLCGDGRPTAEQSYIYKTAYAQLQHNMELIKAGVTCREIAEKAYKLPDNCNGLYYTMIAHGVGLCDEYPSVRHLWHYEQGAWDDVIQTNMVLSVEALVALNDGKEAVKLEEQILVTDTGFRRLSTYPFEEDLMQ